MSLLWLIKGRQRMDRDLVLTEGNDLWQTGFPLRHR